VETDELHVMLKESKANLMMCRAVHARIGTTVEEGLHQESIKRLKILEEEYLYFLNLYNKNTISIKSVEESIDLRSNNLTKLRGELFDLIMTASFSCVLLATLCIYNYTPMGIYISLTEFEDELIRQTQSLINGNCAEVFNISLTPTLHLTDQPVYLQSQL
jgi:hypothetical protein